MKVYVVFREYLNWAETNGAEIVGVFKELEKAEEKIKKVYEEELMFLQQEEYKIVTEEKGRHYIEISTAYGDVNIYITTKEVE